MMSEDINSCLCLKLNLHVKLATVHGKEAEVKRKQHEHASQHTFDLMYSTLSREESLPNSKCPKW